VLLPSQSSFDIRNKNKLDSLSQKLNVKYPKTYEVTSIAELHDVVAVEGFPLMVKGNYYKSYKVFSLDNAISSFTEIANEWGFPVLMQRCVNGEEINLVGIADKNSELKGAVSIKKLTTTELGKIWMGITIHNEQLLQIAKDFVKLASWQGPFELECMVNSTDMYMIEINPRFPAWVYFATDIGINLPQILVDVISNKTIKSQFEYPANKMYVRFVDELVIDFDNYKQIFTKKELTS
jgi:carbamoyl-phosphate synthase large subunit